MTLRDTLFEALRDRASPVLVFPDQVIPAASLWVVMRLWVDAFRAAPIAAGAGVAFALPCNPGGIGAWLAAAWENLAVALPDHPAFTAVRVRCEPGGSLDIADDRLTPWVREQPTGRDIALAPGIHTATEHIAWPSLFARGDAPELVELRRANWITGSALRKLACAVGSAEVIEFV